MSVDRLLEGGRVAVSTTTPDARSRCGCAVGSTTRDRRHCGAPAPSVRSPAVANPDSPDVDTRVAVLEHRADATDRALELLRHDVNQGFATLRDHMDQRFTEVDRRFAQVDQRFDGGDRRGDRQDMRLDQMNDRLDRMNSRLDQHFRWIVTTVITTAFAIIGANIGILTLLLRAR
jgi:hypothetical protein